MISRFLWQDSALIFLFFTISAISELPTDNGDGTYSNDKLKYISIPINIKYTFGFDEVASLYLATGPQFSFNVDNAGLTLDIPDSAGKIINSFKSKNFDFYWNVGIGFTVINHIRLGYTYNIPCTKSVDSPQGSVKNKTNQITLTYLF